MKKLSKKIFFTILSILTLFSLCVLFTTNYQSYKMRKDNTFNILDRVSNDKNKFMMEKHDERPLPEIDNKDIKRIYIDSTVYTINLDDNGNFKELITHTEEEVNEEKIIKVAKKIIENHKDKFHIGNLYIEEYSYAFSKDNKTLTIISNYNIRKENRRLLLSSSLIFILTEIIGIIISYLLTNWIIKPVIDAFEKQNRFIADASHELKTPLAVIMANISAYEKDNDSKWFDNIKNESERMNKLIMNLLDLATLENSKDITLTETNFSKLVEASILPFEGLIYEENIKLKYNIKSDIKLKCDQDKIKQLICILMDNAIKHSNSKGKIIIDLYEEKNNIILEVKNKGKEIPIEEQKHLFERFYRGDESRNRNENRYGLGLSIAKEITELHNGEISVSSKDGFNIFKIILNRK